ncbi:MAG: phosphatidylserine decarboxylase [Fulvivirga sp.]
MTSIYRFVSLNIWGNLPSPIQRNISKLYANIYNKSFTKYIIKPYCKFNRLNEEYLNQFVSESGSEYYASFQDFFTRVFNKPLDITTDYIWPCEGLLCDYGTVQSFDTVNIKGDHKNIKSIFGAPGNDIDDNYNFSNVFLHNNNYHRIHAPTNLVVEEIEHILGDLVMLRPWRYKEAPSLPAMRNERVNLKLVDEKNRFWYLSIVGGPAVGTIQLRPSVRPGYQLSIGEEIGKFLLGSTCCMVSPISTETPNLTKVCVGQCF